jgi:hypothetical protein
MASDPRRDRRSFLARLGTAGAVAATAGLAGCSGDDGQGDATDTPEGPVAATFEFGGHTRGWRGRAPSSIADQVNPTLSLEAGKTYAITWENVDAGSHNVVVETDDGDWPVETDIVSKQGATQTVRFVAAPEMRAYLCEVHPRSMRGSIEVTE